MIKKMLLMSMLVLFVMGLTGCGDSGSDVSTGIKMGETTIIADPNADSWPSDMPDVVPEFTYGAIAGVLSSHPWFIAYGDVQYADLESYKVDLEAKGWEVSLKEGAYGTATLMGYGDEEYTILLSHNGETEGLQLSVMPKE